MKKLLTILFIFLLLPVTIFAKSIHLTDTDVTLDLDEDYWIVFTRDNISDLELLKKYDLSYEYMENVFNSNDAYLDAITFWDSDGTELLELFVIMTPNTGISNINLLEDDDVEEVAKELSKMKQAVVDKYDIYENKVTKYIEFTYKDQGLYLKEYFTIINNKNYLFKFQSAVELDSTKKEILRDVIDKVEINYNIDGQEKIKINGDKKSNSIWLSALKGALLGATAGAIGAFIKYVYNKKKK